VTAVRVLLVDDQPLVRAGLQRILRPRAGFDVVGECADGAEVVDAVRSLEPDIVVMDMRMKAVSGADAIAALRAAGSAVPVLVLTTFDDDQTLATALRAGANGFQLKDAAGEDLIRSVLTVAEGGAWLDPAVTARVLRSYQTAGGGTGAVDDAARRALEGLTAREVEVLTLIGRGRTNAEIATELSISEVTVKTHVAHVFSKAALRDRAAAVVLAFDSGLVAPGASGG
jgi:DNA-binding NarL/FixJ family response regulator